MLTRRFDTQLRRGVAPSNCVNADGPLMVSGLALIHVLVMWEPLSKVFFWPVACAAIVENITI